MIGEVGIKTDDCLAARQILGFQVYAIRRQHKLGLGLQSCQRLRHLAFCTNGNVNVVGLQHAAPWPGKVGFVRRSSPKLLDPCFLVPERQKEGISPKSITTPKGRPIWTGYA